MNTYARSIGKWTLLLCVTAIFAAVSMPTVASASGDTCSNTYRHIYNYSRCSIRMRVETTAGNMYVNGARNSFTISAGSTPEYELTTSDCLSAGKIHVTNLAHGDMILDYHMSNPSGFTFQWFRSSYGGDWGAANVHDCGSVGWNINSPAMGDITFCNSTCP